MLGALLRKLLRDYGALPRIHTRRHTQVAHVHSINILEESFHAFSHSSSETFLFCKRKISQAFIFSKKTWRVWTVEDWLAVIRTVLALKCDIMRYKMGHIVFFFGYLGSLQWGSGGSSVEGC